MFNVIALRLFLVTLLAGGAVCIAHAAEPDPGKKKAKDDKTPADVSLDDDAAAAMKKFRVAPGLKLDVFASEPLIKDVVNFCFDEKGRVYVVESGRRRTSVYDIRRHRDWTDHDFSFRSPADRLDFFKSTLVPENQSLPPEIKIDRNQDGIFDWHDLEVESERIQLVEDLDGDGRADKSTTFADDFRTAISGVAAGVLARRGSVYFTCIPDVWLLQDTQGRGTANLRVKLHSGFGVHIAYGGHDMHGLKFGPDGKLYWSIADRGSHVQAGGKTFANPDTGAVFRCDPDGSNFEVVATGLRNPQELAFDAHGNLFTGDNNADGGDKARWEYIVEGAEYGWHYGWQHLPKLGAWNSERLWHLAPTNTAAYILPPVAHIGHGPAGIAYYPGTGMPDRYKEHFFYADFPGGVRYFTVKPNGASFMVDNPGEYLQDNSPEKIEGKLLWSLYPTDVDFAPGGGAYVLDWVQGWEKTGKGRLFRVFDPAAIDSPVTQQTKHLLAEGMQQRAAKDLGTLLGHPDQRVRLEAQFTLAENSRRKTWKRGALEIRFSRDEALDMLANTARSSPNQLARLHAIWGLGQINRQSPSSGIFDLVQLLRDKDPEVRAQAAKLVGEGKAIEGYRDLVAMLKDASPRVRFFATMALGKLGNKSALAPILEMLRKNTDEDAYLRHAGVMALVWLNEPKAVLAAARDDSRAVRMASLLAMRRLEMPEISLFLNDEPALRMEAARAINDVPINGALPQLASIASDASLAEPTLRRAINANYRLGGPAAAATLAKLAAGSEGPEAARVDAVDALGDWAKPPVRDRVVGLYRPLPSRDARIAGNALQSVLTILMKGAPVSVRIASAGAIEKLGMIEAGPLLFEVVADTKQTAEMRAAALKALAALKDARFTEALKLAQADASEMLRKEASRLSGHGDITDAIASITATLQSGSIGERQAALQAAAGLKGKEADALISKQLDQLLSGKLARELQLDVLDAAARRSAPSIKGKLQSFEAGRDPKDALAKYREALFGGDAKAGRLVFYERAEAGCFRCHKVKGEGGEVGPELASMIKQKGREYVLESIVLPNKLIAAGFESVLVTMKNGQTFAGVLKNETADEMVVNSPEDGLLKLKKADIQKRDRTLSPMPESLMELLSKRDLRDLIEFLAHAN
jgi:quinoprotein glucose dehydrogenase